jgi:hypothetical protein
LAGSGQRESEENKQTDAMRLVGNPHDEHRDS